MKYRISAAIILAVFACSTPRAHYVHTYISVDCGGSWENEHIAAEKHAMHLLTRLEGYSSEPYWDVNAYRNGYGTPALHRHERVNTVEAYRRALNTYRKQSRRVKRDYPGLNELQVAALSVMRYNVGSFGPGLKAAIASGDLGRMAKYMRRYVKSAGEYLPGLAARRELEVKLLENKLAILAK